KRDGDAPTPVTPWRALATAAAVVDLGALSQWLDAQPDAEPEGLDNAGAADVLRPQPGCHARRVRPREQLWPALPRAARPPSRAQAADAMGRRHLDALATPPERTR